MKKRNFFKVLASLLLIPFVPKKAKSFTGNGLNHNLNKPKSQFLADMKKGWISYSFEGESITKTQGFVNGRHVQKWTIPTHGVNSIEYIKRL